MDFVLKRMNFVLRTTNFLLQMTDWTTANGGTWVLPSTHALGDTEHPSLPLTTTGVQREELGAKPAWESGPHPQAVHITGSAVSPVHAVCWFVLHVCALLLCSLSVLFAGGRLPDGLPAVALPSPKPDRHGASHDQLPLSPSHPNGGERTRRRRCWSSNRHKERGSHTGRIHGGSGSDVAEDL